MTQPELKTALLWVLDSSTFIHARIVDRVSLLSALRSPIFFPEYVFRFELGSGAHNDTREAAAKCVQRKQIGVKQLTLADIDRIAQMRRKVGLGEIACAIIAEREDGGVLMDDRKALPWLKTNTRVGFWESIEDFLLDAAMQLHLSEFDLKEFDHTLRTNRYQCRFDDLQIEFLRRRANIQNPGDR